MLARSLMTLSLFAALQSLVLAQCQFNESAVAGAAQNDKLGSAVAIKGEWAVVGAQQLQTGKQGKQGYVEIYRKTPGGWRFTQKLAPTNFEFGRAVATDGRRIVVGAPGFISQRVETYIFDGSEWVAEETIFNPGNPFGVSLAIHDRWLAVADFIGGLGVPMVYVYEHVAGSWVLNATFTGPTSSFYGQGLSLSDNQLLIGNPSNGNGTVDVYELRAGTWQLDDQLTPSNPSLCDFGWDLARDNGQLAITANCDESVVFFTEAGNSWVETDIVAVPPPSLSTFFSGPVVDLSHGLAVVGVRDPAFAGEGHAYVLRHDNGDWSLQNELCIASGASNHADFGSSVAIDTYALVGSPGQGGVGEAFFYPTSDLLHGIAPDR